MDKFRLKSIDLTELQNSYRVLVIKLEESEMIQFMLVDNSNFVKYTAEISFSSTESSYSLVACWKDIKFNLKAKDLIFDFHSNNTISLAFPFGVREFHSPTLKITLMPPSKDVKNKIFKDTFLKLSQEAVQMSHDLRVLTEHNTNDFDTLLGHLGENFKNQYDSAEPNAKYYENYSVSNMYNFEAELIVMKKEMQEIKSSLGDVMHAVKSQNQEYRRKFMVFI